MNPRLEAGKQLLALARRLPKVGNGDEAAAWLADYAEWCSRWERFLREFTLKDGRRLYTHHEDGRGSRGDVCKGLRHIRPEDGWPKRVRLPSFRLGRDAYERISRNGVVLAADE